MNETQGKFSPDKNYVTWPWYALLVVVLLAVVGLTSLHVDNVPGDTDVTLMYGGVLYGNCATHDSVPRYLQCDSIGVLSVPGVTEKTVRHDGVVYGECVGDNAIVELPAASVRCFPLATA